MNQDVNWQKDKNPWDRQKQKPTKSRDKQSTGHCLNDVMKMWKREITMWWPILTLLDRRSTAPAAGSRPGCRSVPRPSCAQWWPWEQAAVQSLPLFTMLYGGLFLWCGVFRHLGGNLIAKLGLRNFLCPFVSKTCHWRRNHTKISEIYTIICKCIIFIYI